MRSCEEYGTWKNVSIYIIVCPVANAMHTKMSKSNICLCPLFVANFVRTSWSFLDLNLQTSAHVIRKFCGLDLPEWKLGNYIIENKNRIMAWNSAIRILEISEKIMLYIDFLQVLLCCTLISSTRSWQRMEITFVPSPKRTSIPRFHSGWKLVYTEIREHQNVWCWHPIPSRNTVARAESIEYRPYKLTAVLGNDLSIPDVNLKFSTAACYR